MTTLNGYFWAIACITTTLATGLVGCQPKAEKIIEVQPTPPSESPSTEDSDAIQLGVLSIDSAVSVNERYAPLVDYLESVTDYDFALVSLSQETQFSKVAEASIDFISANPLASVQIQRLYDTEFLVTHSNPQTGTEFSGLIVVDADSDMQSFEDLRGKRGACVNFQTAAAGCVFQVFHLLERGIDPYQDFSSFVENKSQDNIVLGVLNGTLDFGFIRTGQLEKMERKGLIENKAELRVLEPIDDNFFYEHTTILYPEWPVAALTHVDPEMKSTVEQALLNIPLGDPALKAIGIESFVPAVDYSVLDELVVTLQLKSWDVEQGDE